MKRLLIAFAAAATTFVASAWNNYAHWFTESTDTVNWTGDYEFVDDAYVIDADFDNPATMTPKAEAPDTNTYTKVAINAKITPAAIGTYDDLSEEDVQTALIAAFDANSVTNYYAWLGGDWVALSGATPGDGTTAVDVTITFDYTLATPKANFKVGETTLNTNGVEWIELAGVNKRAVSTVAFAGSGTVNTVDTDVGIAAAMVAGVKYETFAEALAVATAAGTYVELLDNAETSLASIGDSMQVKVNGHNFTVNTADGVACAIDYDGSTGITTYTAAAVVATVGSDKFATLQAAINAAVAGETKTVDLVGAASGAVTIPEGITVQLSSGCSLADVTALYGVGVLFAPSGTVVPLVQTDHAASLLRDAEKWAGTLFIKSATMSGPDGLAYYGNTNSTVRFDNVWLSNFTSSHAIGTLELVGAGVYIQAASGNMILPCALVGDGPISLRDASDTQRTVLFSGDVSAFAGNVTVATDTKSRIVFGSDAGTLGNDNCIVVDSGASVTVAEGKTWTAPNGYVIKGTVTVSGTLAAGSEKVYGTGCVIFTSATAAAASAPIAGSWTGTYVVGWAPTGAFNPNTYGNAKSTVVLSNDLAASAYFGPGSMTTLTINPTVRIAADVEIKNGYSKSDDSCLVTFAKLTGDHKFTTSPGTGGTDANPTTRRYAITTLDNFTGSLKVKAGSELRIATVNVAGGTDLTGLIIPAECDAKSTVEGAHTNGVITGALALTVAGVDSGKTLVYKADGAGGAGLYVAASTDPIPPLPAEPTAADVTNAIEQAKFVDAAAVKAIIDGDPVKYAAFKTWADGVTGGEAAVVAASHAAVSYQLSPIVESATLFANEPELTFTEIAPADTGSNWEVTVELKDGETAVQLKAAVESFATRVWKGASLTTMTQCTASDIDAATQVDGTKVKLSVKPPVGDSGFIKIKAE